MVASYLIIIKQCWNDISYSSIYCLKSIKYNSGNILQSLLNRFGWLYSKDSQETCGKLELWSPTCVDTSSGSKLPTRNMHHASTSFQGYNYYIGNFEIAIQCKFVLNYLRCLRYLSQNWYMTWCSLAIDLNMIKWNVWVWCFLIFFYQFRYDVNNYWSY